MALFLFYGRCEGQVEDKGLVMEGVAFHFLFYSCHTKRGLLTWGSWSGSLLYRLVVIKPGRIFDWYFGMLQDSLLGILKMSMFPPLQRLHTIIYKAQSHNS